MFGKRREALGDCGNVCYSLSSAMGRSELEGYCQYTVLLHFTFFSCYTVM